MQNGLATPCCFLHCVLHFCVIHFLHRTANSAKFNYHDQTAWLKFPGSNCDGKRQSPININTEEVKKSSPLIALKFDKYDHPVAGEFTNMGTNVEFVPGQTGATLTNHLGTYILKQFHFHWGKDACEGSEHRVNRKQFAAEIHFVHLKQGASPSDTAGDTLSVIAVLCKATDTPISGVWDQLSPVPTKHEAKNPISDFVYSDLLPENRDYYHYEGSLTTPLCNETVQWFVLKNTIDIPKEFLAKLRMVESDDSGTLLTFNFRDLQSLNDREVYDFQ